MEREPGNQLTDQEYLDNLAWQEYISGGLWDWDYVELVKDPDIKDTFKHRAIEKLFEGRYLHFPNHFTEIASLGHAVFISGVIRDNMDRLLNEKESKEQIYERFTRYSELRDFNLLLVELLPFLPEEEAETLYTRFQLDDGDFNQGSYEGARRLLEHPDISTSLKTQTIDKFYQKIEEEKGKPKKQIREAGLHGMTHVHTIPDSYHRFANIIAGIAMSDETGISEEFIINEFKFLLSQNSNRRFFWNKGSLTNAVKNIYDNSFARTLLKHELIETDEITDLIITIDDIDKLLHVINTRFEGDEELTNVLLKKKVLLVEKNNKVSESYDRHFSKKDALFERFKKSSDYF